MKIGVLKEVKASEGRVALIPSNVKELKKSGHEVFVQIDAGFLSHFYDDDYREMGATLLDTAGDVIDTCDLIIKVKEPTIEEVKQMRAGQLLFCYLHLAAIPQTMSAILEQKIIAIGFETVEDEHGRLPLLKPMSEIAGQLATQNGAHFLRFDQGGRGVLLGGTDTVPPAEVVILGGGVVGQNAANIAVGMGAKTVLFDVKDDNIARLQKQYGKNCVVLKSTPDAIAKAVLTADLVVGAALVVAEKAPMLVTEEMVRTMKKGSVIVDVSVDQGGCIETSEVTTHHDPIVSKHGVLHYGVANMPGSVPLTATLALNNASFPYIKRLADLGYEKACDAYPELARAVNCAAGEIIHNALKDVS